MSFILVREPLPLMRSPHSHSNLPSETQTLKPDRYIINVSAREGIFESRADLGGLSAAGTGERNMLTSLPCIAGRS